MTPIPLILASASPRRAHLLKQIGLAFQVIPSHVAEPAYTGHDPAAYACELAHLKAAEIAARYPDALVIGADTIVVIGDQVLGKPVDEEDARSMLSSLSDRNHQVITAYSLQLLDKGIEEVYHVLTQVHFRALSQDEIGTYIATGSPFDKAGSYGIQDFSSIFVDRIEGCFYNVVGLPISHLHQRLSSLLKLHSLKLH